MEPELLQMVGTGGAAVAVVVTVILFLRHLRVSREQDRAEREEERKRLLDIIVNDLAHVGEALFEVKVALKQLNGKGAGK